MIIVEGPDGAGKTTLVDSLVGDLMLDKGKRATKDRNKLYEVTRQDTYTALAKGVKGHKKPLIWDRLFFSEMVYSPLVGRACEFSAEEQVFVKKILSTLACPIIMCRPTLDVVEKNVLEADQMEGVKENVRGIYNAYGSVAEDMPWLIWYDYTEELTGKGSFKTYEEIVFAIEHYMTHRSVRSW
jgi:GTPase SAR1 family protein